MTRRPIAFFWAALFGLVAQGACGDRGAGPQDDRAEDPAAAKAPGGAGGGAGAAPPEEAGLQVSTGDVLEKGPLPPEADLVFFTVDGGLLPLGCFDAKTKKVAAAGACLGRVPEGADVAVAASETTVLRKVTGRIEPLCLSGSGKKAALGAEGLASGANYLFGVYPPSVRHGVTLVEEETTSDEATALPEAEAAQWRAAIGRLGAPAGAVEAHQVARVDVDGDSKTDLFVSLLVPDPASNERYRFSAALLALDVDLATARLVARSKRRDEVFELRGLVDIDGDGTRELWLRKNFAEGGGDALVRLSEGEGKPIGRWTCGV